MSTITALGIGSGLDLSGLLDQLNSAEREKLEPLTLQKKSYQSKISAYGKLKSDLDKLQAAMAALDKPALFGGVKSVVTGDAVQAAAGHAATANSYSVDVTQLARNYSVATAGLAEKSTDLGAADIAMTLANGETVNVSVAQESSSLEDIRDAINARNGGVQATIVNDGGASPYRLVLASSTSGTESAISTIDFGALAGELTVDIGTQVSARDAALTVNGINIVSQSNQIEEAVQGVTLNVSELGQATIDISRDTQAIEKGVSAFVSAYNSLKGTIGDLTSFDASSGEAGLLLGDATLRTIESRMRSVLSAMGGGEGSIRTLADIGISLQVDGTLSTDKDALSLKIKSSDAEMQAFFAGSGAGEGLAGRLSNTLEQILRGNGILANVTTGLESSIRRLDERYVVMESSIDTSISRYRAQFGQLDSLMASMNSTSSYLTQQFDLMNAQLGRR